MVSDNHVANSAPGQLREVRHSLLRLHKALLESEREVYERMRGRIETNYKFLELLMHDPWFDWLHRLSELIVQIDERLDAEEPPAEKDAKTLVNQTRILLTPSENGSEFQRRYFTALQESPDVVLAHGEVVRLLGKNSVKPD
ncbi:MAG TPA: hypothetical protein VFH31_17250 [Pyrinomonadaceae bacterium]|nr:hypothetical protein [Pyrinomonadaceae bacterium]